MKKRQQTAVHLVAADRAAEGPPVVELPSVSTPSETITRTPVIGIATIDTDLRYAQVNEGMAALNGLASAEHLGKTLSEVLPRVAVDDVVPKLRLVLATGEPLLRQAGHIETAAHPGVERYYESSYWPDVVDGDIVGVRCLVQDVTDRKQAEEDLRRAHGALQSEVQERTQELAIANASLEESLAELERVYKNSPVGLCVLDTELRFLRINRHLADLTGHTVEEHFGRSLREVLPLVADQAEDAFHEVMESGQPIVDAEVTGPFGANGERRVWRANTHCATGSRGEVTGLSVVVQDITDLRDAQSGLEERLQFERLVSDLSLAFSRISSADIHQQIATSLESVTECFGAERTSVFELFAEPYRLVPVASHSMEGVPDLPSEAVGGKLTWGYNELLKGRPVVFGRLDDLPESAVAERELAQSLGVKSLVLVPLSIGGDLLGTLGIAVVSEARDWSESLMERVSVIGEIFAHGLERRRAERALEVSEERFGDLVEHAPDAMIVGRAEGNIVQANSLAAKLFGYRREELIGLPVRRVIPQARRLDCRKETSDQGQGRSSGSRLRGLRRQGVRKDGTEIPIEVSLSPIGEGPSAVAASSIRDVSSSLAREQELRSSLDDLSDMRSQLEAENLYLKREVGSRQGFEDIVGRSEGLQEVLGKIAQVAGTESTVLIHGETGTGKELLARAIHRESARKDRPMVTLNCGALQPSLVESELFGREKGAYTGASSRQIGRFELADGSTLFLDEIGELQPEIQVKLLRALEEGQFERLGNPRTLTTDVRIVAASNKDLGELVRNGTFREDLFYRLNVFPISVPPLRERRGDIPLLVWAFVKELGQTMGKTIERVPPQSMDALVQYPWPGNVRELRNVVERAMILSPGHTLNVSVPSGGARESTEGLSLDDALKRHIVAALERSGWRIRGAGGAAELLDLKPTTLEYKMKKLEIRRG